MRRVKDYLDENFFPIGEIKTIERQNGHLGVFGEWVYPKNWIPMTVEEFNNGKEEQDYISLLINNETIIVGRICIDGKFCSKYHYLQTYEHIKRGEPDKNGYYARSTDEEVIKYIDSYFVQIARKEVRKKKLKYINEGR